MEGNPCSVDVLAGFGLDQMLFPVAGSALYTSSSEISVSVASCCSSDWETISLSSLLTWWKKDSSKS